MAENSWPTLIAGVIIRTTYIATDSSQRLSFAALQSATAPAHILRIASRPSLFEDMFYGLVIELHLSEDLNPGDAVHLALAHAGATTYYPPQQIDDI